MKNELTKLLSLHGISEDKARKALSDIWTEGEHKEHIKPIGNPTLDIFSGRYRVLA
jgi:hypothetical protein